VESAVLGIGATYATGVWERTAAELDAYSAAWATMHVETCEATSRGEQSAEAMDLRMACLHRAKVEVGAVTAVLATGDAKEVTKAHELTGALPPLSRCADIEALQADVEPPLPRDAEAVEEARSHMAAARAALHIGRFADASTEVEAAKTSVADVAYAPVNTEIALVEGAAHDALGNYDAAEDAYRRALGLAAGSRQWSEVGDAATQLLFVVGHRQQRVEEGLEHRDLALALTEGDAQREAALRTSLGTVLYMGGDFEAAEAEHRRALALRETAHGPEHFLTAAARNNLAGTLQAQGKYAEAEAECRRAVEIRQKALGPDHPLVAASRENLAVVLAAQEKYVEAEAECRQGLALKEKALGIDHPDVGTSHNNLANALQVQEKYEEAEAEYRRAVAIWDKTLGVDHPQIAAARNNLGSALDELGKHEEAEVEHRRALAAWEKALGPHHPSVAASRGNLATTLMAQGRAEEAESEYRSALAIWEKSVGPDHPEAAKCRSNLAALLRERGH
jgi:serine/threonine-protein kinase